MSELIDVVYAIDCEGYIKIIAYDFEKDEDDVVYGLEDVEYDEFDIGVYKNKYYIDENGDPQLVEDEPEILWKL